MEGMWRAACKKWTTNLQLMLVDGVKAVIQWLG